MAGHLDTSEKGARMYENHFINRGGLLKRSTSTRLKQLFGRVEIT
ncbi:predicted protein [Sclerotinia sclerotiorum 1980 UF-70]|uniref:Uncharacterized protein n=1 Tax=Sclerotinia sclerotiorum (strain ATCC 18683 / 1980 / Ss-1) TaxID=665079 RepID=A7ERE8_SCLS1|nr:predicted protein [Sclerotinia sclerotiorum 1980 UF-70]EDN92040.1 predicted protein [Sclerotinia sclerotiorum 1980 UF-70]